MNKKEIINKTVEFVKSTLTKAEGGHDWWHIYRVWKSAKSLAKTENVDIFIVELGALLHDIADSKFHGGDEEIGAIKASKFLTSINVDQPTIVHITNIINNISFKGGKEKQTFNSKELEVLQDADRLDAIGAIGISRAFSYGGYKMRELYNPNISPNLQMTKEEYKNSTAPTINHFYEKLLLLKDRMNTQAGKKAAEKRHEYMETFLTQFYAEWEGDL